MATLNKVMLIGRAASDPSEPKVLQSGTKVVDFRLAVGRSKKNADGQWENDPNPLYIDATAFSFADAKRDLAGIIASYVKKGDQVYVEGELRYEEWEDKNGGGKRSKHKLVLQNIEFLASKGRPDEGGGEPAPKAAKPQAEPKKPAGRRGSVPVPTDDGGDGDQIPF